MEKGGEQFFSDLVPRLKGKEGPLLEANLRMAWLLFDNRDSLGGRIYNFNKVLGEKAEHVLAQLAERLDIEEEQTEEVEGVVQDEMEIDLGGEPVGNDYAPLLALFDNPQRRDEVFDELKAVCQTVLDSGAQNKVGKAALRAAQDANTRLPQQPSDIQSQLDFLWPGAGLGLQISRGEGISLHKICHDALYLDRSYVTTHYLQSIDRIHRLGLAPGVETNIYIYRTLAPLGLGCIDHSVSHRLRQKLRALQILLDDPDLHEIAYDEENSEDPIAWDISPDDVRDLIEVLEGRAHFSDEDSE